MSTLFVQPLYVFGIDDVESHASMRNANNRHLTHHWKCVPAELCAKFALGLTIAGKWRKLGLHRCMIGGGWRRAGKSFPPCHM